MESTAWQLLGRGWQQAAGGPPKAHTVRFARSATRRGPAPARRVHSCRKHANGASRAQQALQRARIAMPHERSSCHSSLSNGAYSNGPCPRTSIGQQQPAGMLRAPPAPAAHSKLQTKTIASALRYWVGAAAQIPGSARKAEAAPAAAAARIGCSACAPGPSRDARRVGWPTPLQAATADSAEGSPDP